MSEQELPERCRTGKHEWYLRSDGTIFCRRCGKKEERSDERKAMGRAVPQDAG